MPADIDGAVLSRVVDSVIENIKDAAVPVGAIEANDAAQAILTPILTESFEIEGAEKILRESAWLGNVYAVAEERVCQGKSSEQAE